ncbi:MAG: PHP domain-containing protein [Nitrospinae bacterium]|nr:PHP domain-containing protein [Nitrospinota bacterium]
MKTKKSEIHMHSNFSDGEFSPEELVSIAERNRVSILSLTDHDTFAGIGGFLAAARGRGIVAFPGIEITVLYRDFNLHLLGYFENEESIRPELRGKVQRMKDQREGRMRDLIVRINEVVPERFRGTVLFDNVTRAAEGVVARPHLAREMTRLGIVSNSNEAFEKYLVKYNIEKKNLDIGEAIHLVRQSQGVPVLAHPGERQYSLYAPEKGRDYDDVEAMLEELKSLGLLGLECIYPYHEKIGKVAYYKKLAKKSGLIVTGSRDFHGFSAHQRANILGSTSMDDAFLQGFREIWG